ncbi:MAG: pyridoxine 5'-phosphate synthase [Flavobacteriales bacterium]|nr:MAG: pyridoxine 5'-phosphate synthase [Flavobacteriales bacterium]
MLEIISTKNAFDNHGIALGPTLSVNLNKIATLRNARGGNNPDILLVARDCERFGAQGITVHPRPDGRHIRHDDVVELSKIIGTEFNIEGYPTEEFLQLIEKINPAQVTLVPDPPDALTSNAGWNTLQEKDFLCDVVARIKASHARVSLFLNPDPRMVEAAALSGASRIELYTEAYAKGFYSDPVVALKPYIETANMALQAGLGINAGHDLNLENLNYLAKNLNGLQEVSIGHALICDALYFGLQNTIQMYLKQLKQ